MGNIHAQILEEVFVNGSLLKSEIIQIMKDGQEIIQAIEELIARNLLIGAQQNLIQIED